MSKVEKIDKKKVDNEKSQKKDIPKSTYSKKKKIKKNRIKKKCKIIIRKMIKKDLSYAKTITFIRPGKSLKYLHAFLQLFYILFMLHFS